MNDSETVRIRERNAKRTVNACHRCQSRKIRCDGVIPSCGSCVKGRMPCHYSQRRWRGPAKSGQYIRMLEERLAKVESSSQQPRLPPSLSHNDAKDERSCRKSDPAVKVHEHQNRLRAGTESKSAQPPGNNTERLDVRLPPKRRNVPLSRVLGRDTLKPFVAKLDFGCLRRTIFAPIPPESFVVPFMTIVMEEMREVCPLFTTESYLGLFQQQFAAGQDKSIDSPSRWATLHGLLAMATQWKASNNAIEELFPMSWSYFKNAFSVFPELILKGTDVHACQAILAMAMFMHGTADARTSSHLVAATARSLQNLGLHRRKPYLTMNPRVAEEHKRAVWITHILSSNATMKYDLPSAFSDDEFDVELPSDDPLDGLGNFALANQKSINLLRLMSELSVIQSNIHRRLYSSMAMRSSPTELLAAVMELHQQLETWKSSVPAEIQIFYTGIPTGAELPVSILQLHWAYYHAVGKVHRVIPNRQHHDATDLAQPENLAAGWERPKMLSSSQICSAAARATLSLLPDMPPLPLSYVWQIMCYPLCAFITLVATVLEDASEAQAQLDVRCTREFIRYLERLVVEEGCDLHKLLDGCSKLQNLVAVAVDIQRDLSHSVETTNGKHGGHGISEHCERVRLSLSSSTDHMLLAHGLMSNMPTLHVQAVEFFETIDPSTAEDEYDGFGPFAPETLLPQSYNFTFGPWR